MGIDGDAVQRTRQNDTGVTPKSPNISPAGASVPEGWFVRSLQGSVCVSAEDEGDREHRLGLMSASSNSSFPELEL